MPASEVILATDSAILRACDSDSMTQGPAMRKRGFFAPRRREWSAISWGAVILSWTMIQKRERFVANGREIETLKRAGQARPLQTELLMRWRVGRRLRPGRDVFQLRDDFCFFYARWRRR